MTPKANACASFAAVLGLFFAAANFTCAEAASDALIKAARAEGGLTLYSSSAPNESKGLLAAFEKKYAIKGTYLRLTTTPLVQRFATENDNKANQADVLSISSPAPFESNPEWFLALRPQVVPNIAKWPTKWVHERHIIWTTNIMVVTYNTDQVTAANVPNSWRDVADAKWQGKILLTDPRGSDNYIGWLDAVEKQLGMDYLRKIAGLGVKMTNSGASGAQMVAAGAFALNFPSFPSFSTKLIESKAPVVAKKLTGPTVVSPRSIAIAAHAPHPNTARLYLDWLFSEEGVRILCGITPVSVPADPAGKLGCVPAPDARPIDFNISAERKQALLKAIGIAN